MHWKNHLLDRALCAEKSQEITEIVVANGKITPT